MSSTSSNKVMMAALLIISAALPLLPVFAEEVERRFQVSEPETSQFEKNLEERLARDIKAYLGHDFFIVRISALLEQVKVFEQKEELIPQPPVEQEQPAAEQPEPEAEQAVPEEDAAVSQMELETEDGITPDSLSQLLDIETPLPGLPVPESVFQPAQQASKQKNAAKDKPAKAKPKPKPKPAPPRLVPQPPIKKVTETLKDTRVETRKLSIKVLMDEHITPEQEVFIRQLVIEKANLSFIRGDELQMLRSQFPGAAVLDPPPEEPPVEEVKPEPVVEEPPVAQEEQKPEQMPVEEPTWLEQNWPWLAGAGAALLLLLLLMLLRRKPKPEPVVEAPPAQESETTKKINELLSKLHEKHDTVTTNRMQAIREEIVSMAVTDYSMVSNQLTEWLSSGQDPDIERMASLYNLLGEDHFGSLFKSLIKPDKMVALAVKAQEQKQEMQTKEQLELAEELYQTFMQRRYRELHNQDQSIRPFSFLEKLNDDQILYLLNEEGIKVKALVFSQLNSDRAATLLRRLNESERNKVATEISHFSQLPVSAFRDVANRLARKAVNVPSFANISVDGVDLLVDMLDYMDTADETAMLKGLQKENPELYYKIKQVYISFNDLVRIPQLGLKNLIRETEREELALALFDASDNFREIFYNAMLERPRAMLQSTLRSLSDPAPASVETAKRELSRRARAMLKAGAFALPQEQGEKPKAVPKPKPKGNAAA